MKIFPSFSKYGIPFEEKRNFEWYPPFYTEQVPFTLGRSKKERTLFVTKRWISVEATYYTINFYVMEEVFIDGLGYMERIIHTETVGGERLDSTKYGRLVREGVKNKELQGSLVSYLLCMFFAELEFEWFETYFPTAFEEEKNRQVLEVTQDLAVRE